MTALAIAAAVIVVTGLLVYMARQNASANEKASASEARAETAIAERNDSERGESDAEAIAAELGRRLEASEAQRNETLAKEANDAAETIRTAADPVAAFNRLFAPDVPAVREADSAGAGGADHHPAAPVPPADDAGESEPGRRT